MQEDTRTLSKNWHLAQTNDEQKIAEFELILWRTFYGFLRWQEDCECAVNNQELTGHELAVLHLIRMRDRPKTIYEIAQLLNRTDVPNIQYSIKKLLNLKLIEKADKTVKKAVAYQVTEQGYRDTDTYTKARREVFVKLFVEEIGAEIDGAATLLTKLKNAYEEASRIIVTYREDDLSAFSKDQSTMEQIEY